MRATLVVCLVAAALALNVEDFQYGTNGCSTGAVRGLNEQILAEFECLEPGRMKSYEGSPGLDTSGGGVFPYMQHPAADSLIAAGADASASGFTIVLNSGLRTDAQQWLLYRWGQQSVCNIGLAAQPGRSNHNNGLAIDVDNSSTSRSTLQSNSFTWYGSADAVHYTYNGGNTVDVRPHMTEAFQILWNKMNPNDQISEDGDYGPQTEARLKMSPADGFEDPNGLIGCGSSNTAAIVGGSVGGGAVLVAGAVVVYRSNNKKATSASAEDGASKVGGTVDLGKSSTGSKHSKGSKGSRSSGGRRHSSASRRKSSASRRHSSASRRKSSSGRRRSSSTRRSADGQSDGSRHGRRGSRSLKPVEAE